MRTSFNFSLPFIATILSAALSACGGGTNAGTNATMSSSAAQTATTLATGVADSGTATWTTCAAEGDTCKVNGTAEVRYGTATQYVTKTVTGSVSCSNDVFGDPAFNQVKSCSVVSEAATGTVAAAATTVWTACATEGGTCNVNGTAQVRYGTPTQYVTKTVTGPVACSNDVFGDPAFNQAKSCSIASTLAVSPMPTPAPAAAWTACANEGGICNISGTVEVRYGTATQYVTKTVTGSVTCSNSVFGDPAPNAVKTCSLGTTDTTPPPSATLPVPAPSTPTSPLPSVPPVAGAITNVFLENGATVTQNNVPVSFGQVFSKGHLLSTDKLSGQLDDGTLVPLQVDVKATHADGSVRHAVISAILPSIAPSKVRTMSLVKGGAAPTGTVALDSLTRTGFSASVHAKINGVDYYAAADDLLKAGKATTWLSGPLATEWLVSAPLQTASGAQHPHLSARFAIRWYPNAAKARVDVTVENDWAYEPSPQNFTYDASVLVGGQSVYSQAALKHLHHARWRKLFWFNGSAPAVNVKHNTAYLIATGAVPNYDQSLVIPENSITGFQTHWNAVSKDPMGAGLITPYMPTTGGRDDIGLLPNWAATYLLSQDSRMKEMTLRTADLAGSFSAHYRDKKTGRPVSLADYPYMTINGRSTDTMNPATGKYEAFPVCGGDCASPYTHDASHQPNLAYLPYLVTGDYYYLEELQFWGMWDAFETNPGYRENAKGIVSSEQVRGQAWSLRTLAEAAYITPDNDSLKAAFNGIIDSNLDWYNKIYLNTAGANKLGVIVNGEALVYDGGLGISPWQDDFFTSAIGHAAELGFTKANTLLAWKAKFPISRMVGAGACWIDAAIYQMHVRGSANGPYYDTIAQAYASMHDATFSALQCGSSAMAAVLGLKVGEMTGYADVATGYPSNLQPALAYAATVGGAEGKSAWALFAGRAVKPDYRYAPQFAIVPR
jgi:hypothetical protein